MRSSRWAPSTTASPSSWASPPTRCSRGSSPMPTPCAARPASRLAPRRRPARPRSSRKRRRARRICWRSSFSTTCSDRHRPGAHRSRRLRGGCRRLPGLAGEAAGPAGVGRAVAAFRGTRPAPGLVRGRRLGLPRRRPGPRGIRLGCVEGRPAVQHPCGGHRRRVPGARSALPAAGRRGLRRARHRGRDGPGAPRPRRNARDRARADPLDRAGAARLLRRRGHRRAGARLRALAALPGQREAAQVEAPRQAVRAPALAGADRSGGMAPVGVGVRLPLRRHRHRIARLARGERLGISPGAEAGLRGARLGAARRPDPGQAGRRLARAAAGLPGGGGVLAAGRDVRGPAGRAAAHHGRRGGAAHAGEGLTVAVLFCVGLSHKQVSIAVREQLAVSAAKRVRTETAIARGAVSVSSVSVQMARKVLGDPAGRAVLLIGAGEMAQLAARELQASGAELLVANRTGTASEALAAEVGGIAVGLGELPALLQRADVVLCSTAAQQPLVTREVVGRGIKARRFRPLFLIDLALPRNVDPAVNELENVYVYDLDELERVAAQNRDLRGQEVQRAEAIVREETVAYARAKQERAAVPVLARLRAHAQALADAEVERTLALLGPLSERHQKSLRSMAGAIVNKLLHGPTARLRGEHGGPLADAAAELFGLPDAEPEAPRSENSSPAASGEPQAASRDPQAGADVLPLTGRK